jgi:hypothetical protein
MLIRLRLLCACLVFLFSGLLLASGQAIDAQSVGRAPSPAAAAAPSQPLQSASPQTPQALQPAQAPGYISAKPQTPPEPVTKFEDVVRFVQKEGRSVALGNNLAQDLGLATFSEYMLPVQTHVLDDLDSHRAIYVIDDTRAVLFMIKTGDTPVIYLADRAGKLRKAGRIHTGRLLSQSLQRIPMNEAGTGFNAEREFWIGICKGADPTKVKQLVGLSLAKVNGTAAVAPPAVPTPVAPAGRVANQTTKVATPARGKHSGAALTVSSTPDGAEIEIDHKVAGNTPMTIPLSHGEHWVTLRKDGYRLWRRRINTEGSPLELNAELLPQKDKVHWF